MNKTIITTIFFFLLVSTAVMGVKPTQATGLNGLQVVFHPFETMNVNYDLEIPIHVYNLLDGTAVITNTNCTIHVYNNSGHHIYTNSTITIQHDYDYEFLINKSLFMVGKPYFFNVYCECSDCGVDSSALGGFVRTNFFTSYDDDGREFNFNSLIMLLAGFLMIGVMLKISYNLEEEHILLKLFLTIISFLLGVACINLGLTTIVNSFPSSAIVNASTTIYRVVMTAIYLFFAYITIYYVWRLLNYINDEFIKRK